MRRGGDGYDMFADDAIDPYDAGALLADSVAEYIGAHAPVSPAVEGRITKMEAPAELPTTGGESVQVPAASLILVLGVMLVASGVYARRRERSKA
jgi:5'-nucleotidase